MSFVEIITRLCITFLQTAYWQAENFMIIPVHVRETIYTRTNILAYTHTRTRVCIILRLDF